MLDKIKKLGYEELHDKLAREEFDILNVFTYDGNLRVEVDIEGTDVTIREINDEWHIGESVIDDNPEDVVQILLSYTDENQGDRDD